MSTTTKDVQPALGSYYRPIAQDLEEVERILARELSSPFPYVQELTGHLAHYRGKRLRPALLLLVGRACGRVTPVHHLLGAVVEMIHTATLVHDDVLDHADVRRHVPTVNAKWGNSASVMLGDWLFAHACYLTAALGDPVIWELIGRTTTKLCEGELRQIGERGNLDLSEKEYFEIIRGKTGELVACGCRLGALLSGASEPVLEGMTRYGRELGIAFQIADDLLDVIGEEDEVGKSLGTDVDQQKLTLPLIRLLQDSDPEVNRRVRQTLTGSENHKRNKLRSDLEESDAISYAIRQAEQFARNARRELYCLPASDCRQILEDMTQVVVHRSR